ncbi:MAG: two component transcriptional regulator, winged helix family [Chlorobi bacterium]|nr:two component transcriptional regulator, winged helix family [Chlorobiota bacterium]
MRILLVEDDQGIAEVIRRELASQHYSIDIAYDGEEGEDLALSSDYDIILLDLMLPKKDGRDVCRALRKEGITTPILMMTALGEAEDMIQGLDVGADDYLVKPFHIGVLLARIRSLSRRQSDQKSTEMTIADLVLNTAKRTVTRSGVPITLTAKEFALLEYFMLRRGKVVTRDMISEHVWDMNFDPRSNVVDSLVRFLRQRVDKGFEPQLIHTVRGVGYLFSDEET